VASAGAGLPGAARHGTGDGAGIDGDAVHVDEMLANVQSPPRTGSIASGSGPAWCEACPSCADAGRRLTLARGERLFRRGGVIRELYPMSSGALCLQRDTLDGTALTLHRASARRRSSFP